MFYRQRMSKSGYGAVFRSEPKPLHIVDVETKLHDPEKTMQIHPNARAKNC